MAMISNIELTQEQAILQIELAERRILEMHQRVAKILKSINYEEQLIESLKSIITVSTNSAQTLQPIPAKVAIQYDPNASWAIKAKFVLVKEKKLLTLNGILKIIETKYEPNIKTDAKIRSNLAGQLKMNIDADKVFKRIKIDSDDPRFYYGLKRWFDEYGYVGEEYLPESE